MTVKELIKELSQYDDDDIVVTEFEEEFYDIRSVYIKKVRENINSNLSHGDYYTTSWDECPDPQVSVLVLAQEKL